MGIFSENIKKPCWVEVSNGTEESEEFLGPLTLCTLVEVKAGEKELATQKPFLLAVACTVSKQQFSLLLDRKYET